VTDQEDADLVTQLAAARDERLSALARDDRDTAALLAVWMDALLDEWNRRTAR
jgi:hypothetical protein